MKRSVAFYVLRVMATAFLVAALMAAVVNDVPSVVTALAALSLGCGTLAVLFEY